MDRSKDALDSGRVTLPQNISESLPPMPAAADYSGDALKAFRRGVRAAKAYYRACESRDVDYCAIVERADARDEHGAWYDGFDSICNPEYFETTEGN